MAEVAGSQTSVQNQIDTLNSNIATLQKRITIKTSTVSFMNAEGTTSQYHAAALADRIANNPSSHIGKFENITNGGVYGVLTSGDTEKYWQSIIFGYNDKYISIATYRNGTYYWTRILIGTW